MHSDELPVKQYAYPCWPPIMKINYQYADLLNEEQKHTKHKHTYEFLLVFHSGYGPIFVPFTS